MCDGCSGGTVKIIFSGVPSQFSAAITTTATVYKTPPLVAFITGGQRGQPITANKVRSEQTDQTEHQTTTIHHRQQRHQHQQR